MYHKIIPVLDKLLTWENSLGCWDAPCWDELKELREELREFSATPQEIEKAKDLYQTDEIEIDDFDVMTSPSDNGIWVSAWVWVSDKDLSMEEGE